MEPAMNKLSQVIVLSFTLLLLAPHCYARKIAGIDVPEIYPSSQARLLLNGAGVRTKFFLKLYVGSLYLQEKNSSAEKIIQADEPMVIRLQIISSMISGEKMDKASREGFDKSTHGKIEPIKERIEKFIAVFQEKININDVYDLIYLPVQGVEVHKNGKLHSVIEGLDFKEALFGIWLGDQPAQQSLKEEMLGQ